MGIEGEDFIGNPNKIEYTDDELEYEYYDTGEVEMDLIGEPDDRPNLNNLLGEVLDDSDDEEDENWYDEMDEDDEEDDDDDVESYYGNDINNFLSDTSETDPDELRMTLVNGVFVPASNLLEQPSTTEASTEANANADNNDVALKSSDAASTTSPSDTVENPPS